MKNAVQLKANKPLYASPKMLTTEQLIEENESLIQKLNYYRKNDLSEYIFGRVPPHNIALEEAVLGTIIIQTDGFSKISNLLEASDFYIASHQMIFQACKDLIKEKTTVELLLLTEFLLRKKKKEFEAFGGAYALIELTNRVASSANIEHHARIVKQNSIERQAISTAHDLIKSVYNKSDDIFNILDATTKRLAYRGLDPIFIGGTAEEVMKMAEAAKDIENLCGNLYKTGDFCLFIAPKKTGKTIWGYQVANDLSKGQGTFNDLLTNNVGERKVLYVDMEMNLSDFKSRYRNQQSGKSYPFSKNLIIQMINPKNFDFETEKMLNEIEKLIIEHNPQDVFIDNLTSLVKSISDGDSALLVGKRILLWRYVYGISIKVMCHTPKRLGNLPFISDDILGSGIFLIMATSIYGIRRSFRDKNIIYLKHFDDRSTPLIYEEDNVILMSIQKVDNFTQMIFEGTAREIDHLAKKGSEEEGEIWEEAIEMYNKGISWAKVKSNFNYQYTAQMLQKNCVKHGEITRSWTYIKEKQKFISWIDDNVEEIPFDDDKEDEPLKVVKVETEVTEVTEVPSI